MLKLNMSGFFKRFLISAFMLTICIVAVYIIIQQTIRRDANSPQDKISQDLSIELAEGYDPVKSVAGVEVINPKDNNSPFVIIFDDSTKVSASTANFNGEIPVPPHGVFEYAKNIAENRITWQPYKDLRIAAVINRYGGKNPGYVLAGRNLKDSENSIAKVLNKMFIVWVCGMVLLLVLNALIKPEIYKKLRRNSKT